MAVRDSYSKARAKKNSSSVDYDLDISNKQKKKVSKTVKKAPILIVVVIAVIFGVLSGYFAFSYTSNFQMLSYAVNGVKSEESDYVIVDVSKHREDLEKDGKTATMQEIYQSLELEDNGVECKFFGQDISDTITKRFLYREDISQETQIVQKIDVSVPGVYYIEYTSSHFAFKSKKLIRTIIITEVEVDG